MSICVFGDSVAKGVIYDESKGKYTFLKDNFISQVQSFINVPFKNFAKFGCTITKGEEILDKQVGNLSDYKYTILEFGGNDCDLNWAEVAQNPNCQHLAQVPMEIFKDCYIKMIEKTRSAGSKPILLSLPPLDPERFFSWVSKGLNKENILEFLGNDVKYIYRWHEGYNDMIFRLAEEYNVPVIDIRTDFLKEKNYKNLLCIDGMHPNEKGHKVIAHSLEQALTKIALNN